MARTYATGGADGGGGRGRGRGSRFAEPAAAPPPTSSSSSSKPAADTSRAQTQAAAEARDFVKPPPAPASRAAAEAGRGHVRAHGRGQAFRTEPRQAGPAPAGPAAATAGMGVGAEAAVPPHGRSGPRDAAQGLAGRYVPRLPRAGRGAGPATGPAPLPPSQQQQPQQRAQPQQAPSAEAVGRFSPGTFLPPRPTAPLPTAAVPAPEARAKPAARKEKAQTKGEEEEVLPEGEEADLEADQELDEGEAEAAVKDDEPPGEVDEDVPAAERARERELAERHRREREAERYEARPLGSQGARLVAAPKKRPAGGPKGEKRERRELPVPLSAAEAALKKLEEEEGRGVAAPVMFGGSKAKPRRKEDRDKDEDQRVDATPAEGTEDDDTPDKDALQALGEIHKMVNFRLRVMQTGYKYEIQPFLEAYARRKAKRKLFWQRLSEASKDPELRKAARLARRERLRNAKAALKAARAERRAEDASGKKKKKSGGGGGGGASPAKAIALAGGVLARARELATTRTKQTSVSDEAEGERTAEDQAAEAERLSLEQPLTAFWITQGPEDDLRLDHTLAEFSRAVAFNPHYTAKQRAKLQARLRRDVDMLRFDMISQPAHRERLVKKMIQHVRP